MHTHGPDVKALDLNGLRRGSDSKMARELIEDRTTDRRVFEMDDGTRRLELHANPIWCQRHQGGLQDIDTRIVPDGVNHVTVD